MLTGDLFRLSFHNLLLHKIRSFLTSLGIIFGVGSVISMLAISEGAKKKSLDQIKAMGIDKIIVYTKKPSEKGTEESSSSNNSMVKRYGLTDVDYQHLKLLDNVVRIGTIKDLRQKILKGTTQLDIMPVAVKVAFLKDSGSQMISGRWLSDIDNRNTSNVCVIGKNVKRKLFRLGDTRALGSFVRMGSGVFKIIGILENNLGSQIADLDSPNNMIFVPFQTARAIYGNESWETKQHAAEVTHVEHDVFMIKIHDIAFIDDTSKRIQEYMGKVHKKVKDWGMLVPYDLLKQREQTQNIFTIVMSSIAGISLIVGGVGIMNIMLANVYERRKEIGTRLALGAKKNDILRQFLIETVFLTSLGGLIGVGLGMGLSTLITYYAGWPVIFSMWSIGLSLFISAMVGIIFGTYPAWKAAQQNPIEVLRAE